MKTMLFNPYTGTPRHPSDIASDPEGILLLDPDEPVRAAPTAVEPDERAEFEAWYFDKFLMRAERHLLGPDRYAYPHTQDTWTGWQARATTGSAA